MAQAFRAPSSTNYHPQATNYVISFARRKDRFKLNRYAQLVEAPAPAFNYYELDRDQMVRVPSLAGQVWADGAKRPMRADNQFPFRLKRETCVRYDFDTYIGHVTLEQHNKAWDIKQHYLMGLTCQAMTARTKNVWRGVGTGGWLGLDNSSTWPSTNVADVNETNQGAGMWDAASATPESRSYMAIKRSLTYCANKILLNSNGAVTMADLRLIVHPDCARAMANSAEIREHYKYGGATVREALSPSDGYNDLDDTYGLPRKLYGMEVVVEDAMVIEELPTAGATSASDARDFIKEKTSAVIVTRQGAIDAVAAPAFSTFQIWYYGDQMTVEEFSDPVDRLTRMHITDYYTPVAPAPVSGFLIQNVLPEGA